MGKLLPDDYKLPCDIHLPPNTYIRKGCTIATLATALRAREKWQDGTTFDLSGSKLTDDTRKLIAGWANPAPDASPVRAPSEKVEMAIPAPSREAESEIQDSLRKEAWAYRETMIPKADALHGSAPLWYGWAIFDAYIAGGASNATRATDRLDLVTRWQADCEKAERKLAILRRAAERVCWFDWSDNDEDAVQSISDLRKALIRQDTPSEQDERYRALAEMAEEAKRLGLE